MILVLRRVFISCYNDMYYKCWVVSCCVMFSKNVVTNVRLRHVNMKRLCHVNKKGVINIGLCYVNKKGVSNVRLRHVNIKRLCHVNKKGVINY